LIDWHKLHAMQRELYARADWIANGVSEPPERIAYVTQHNLKLDEIGAHAGLFGVCLCIFPGVSNTSGLPSFYFCPDGVPSAVVEVLDDDGRTILDLLAWPLSEPAAFATAIGNADLVGATTMRNTVNHRFKQPLLVHRTPSGWVMAGCRGCVIVNPEYAGYWLRKCNRQILAEDLEHGRELKQILQRKRVTRTPLPEFDMRNLLVSASPMIRLAA
jgi:hypothetical protein